MSVTDEIKSRIDIVDYVQRHVPGLKKAGRNHKACCPFHNEKTPSFVVNPDRQSWHCFGACAEGGDLFTFAQKIHGWDFKEALRELAAEAGIELRSQTPEQKSQNEKLDRLRGLASAAAELFHERLLREDAASVLAYVRDRRGIKAETLTTFQLGYAPPSWDWLLNSLRRIGYKNDDVVEAGLAIRNETGRVYDRFRNRLMIPIRDGRGRVVGFGGRALAADEGAKYINSPQSPLFDKSQLLFGFDMGRRAIRDSGAAVIVEGYMDVIQAHQAGHLNVVAQMGTAMTERQLRLIAPRYAQKIVLALDADEAGTSAARRSLEVARQSLADDFAGKLSVDLRILRLPAGKDPDDLLRGQPDAWAALVADAQSAADFVIAMQTNDLDPGASLQERQAIASELLPLLLASENNLYKQENIQKLSRRLRIAERELLAWARESLPLRRPTQPPPLEPPPPDPWGDEFDEFHPDPGGPAPQDGRMAQPARARDSGDRAIEPYCLSLLLKNPNLLYQVNRKFRELAEDDAELLRGPLCELGADDFTRSQYRLLMSRLQEALAQDDQEPLEYVAAVVEADLKPEFDALLLDGPELVSRAMRRNFQVDLNDIFGRRPLQSRPRRSDREELIGRALQLRLLRLETERTEMQYLQEEAQSDPADDGRQRERINMKIMLSLRAKALINLAVSEQPLNRRKTSIS